MHAPLPPNCSLLIAKITQDENQDTWLVFQEEHHQGQEFALYFERLADSAANYLVTEVSGEVFLCACWGREKSPLPGFGHVVGRALSVVACSALFMISVMSPPCVQGLGSLGEGRQRGGNAARPCRRRVSKCSRWAKVSYCSRGYK